MRFSENAAERLLQKQGEKPNAGTKEQFSEKHVIKACVDYLSLRGYIVIRNNSGRIFVEGRTGKIRMVKFGETGSPDLVACSPEGRFVAVECKGPKGKLSEHQRLFLERLRRKHGQVIVARSIDDLVNAGI